MRKYILIITALMITGIQGFAQVLDNVEKPVFGAGEVLNYKLKYGIFTAAEADLKVEESPKKFDNKPAYHITATGRTAGTFNVFYKVRNTYESYIDKTTLMPYYYTENRKEGSYKHTDDVTFNHTTGKINGKRGEFDFKGRMFDFVSAYYFARSIDVSKLKIGDVLTMPYFLDDGIQSLTVTYLGREKVECSMGKFNCLKFNPTIIPGKIFKKNSKLYLWVTDDGNRIPVRAHVEVIVGSLTMDLTGAKGLKYPLNPLKD